MVILLPDGSGYIPLLIPSRMASMPKDSMWALSCYSQPEVSIVFFFAISPHAANLLEKDVIAADIDFSGIPDTYSVAR